MVHSPEAAQLDINKTILDAERTGLKQILDSRLERHAPLVRELGQAVHPAPCAAAGDRHSLEVLRSRAHYHHRLDLATRADHAALPASFFARLIAGRTPFAARSAFTRAFCLGFKVRRWPMYWP
jgi:hypothetical protein